MERSPYLEASGPKLVKKFLAFYFHKSSPLVPALNQINSVHTAPSPNPFLGDPFLILYHWCPCLPSGLFPSCFPTKTLCAPPLHTSHALSILFLNFMYFVDAFVAITFQSIFMNDSSLSALTAQLGLITHPKTSRHKLQD